MTKAETLMIERLDKLESSMLLLEREVSQQGQRLSVLEQRITSIENGYVMVREPEAEP